MRRRRDERLLLLSVYSFDRAHHLDPIVREAVRNGWEVRLWAMDHEHPNLSEWTVRHGNDPLGRFHKINLLAGNPAAGQGLIVCDDDVAFERGSLRRLVDTSLRYGFALSQPSHAEGSFASHPFTRNVPGLSARETTFVEIGPLFYVDASATRAFLPFPEFSPLGWGVEADWESLRRSHGFRFGIVDSLRIRHLYKPGRYPMQLRAAEERVAQQRLQRLGMTAITDLMHVIAEYPSAARPFMSVLRPAKRVRDGLGRRARDLSSLLRGLHGSTRRPKSMSPESPDRQDGDVTR